MSPINYQRMLMRERMEDRFAQHLSEGLEPLEAARKMKISEPTARRYFRSIKEKLGLQAR